MERLMRFLEHLRTDGDEIAWTCSVRSLYNCCSNCFPDGKLDAGLLRKAIAHEGVFFREGIENVYRNYVVDKMMKLVLYMNTFRRYTDGKQIADDFMKVTGGVNHCGSQPSNYYFAFNSWGGYIFHFLQRYMRDFWHEFAPNGVLDNGLFRDFMIERHERGIKKYGIGAVIRRNFKNDWACYSNAYFPYRGGAAPVYLKTKRGFVKSCGEGAGPNQIPDFFEFELIKPLLENNPDYRMIDGFHIPQQDDTLPVFSRNGMIEFESEEEKRQFIREHRK